MQSTACCVPATPTAVDRVTATEVATLFKALADPARVQLVALLAAAESGERCVCELTEPLGLSQPTVSHHLRILTHAGLITRSQRGTWAWYTLNPTQFDRIADIVQGLSRASAAAGGGGRCG